MTELEKRKAVHEFFVAPRPERDIRAIVIGVSLLLLGVYLLIKSFGGTGVVFVVVGFVWTVFMPFWKKLKPSEPENEVQIFSIARYDGAKARYEARPSYAQVLTWLREDLVSVAKRSEEKLGLVETTKDPILVVGSAYEYVDGIADELVLRRRVGEKYFYSTYRLSSFQFTSQLLGAYQAIYNIIKNVTTCEETSEFFYRDVVSVQTKTDASNYTLKTGEKLEHSKMFSLAVSSGDKISVVINDPKIQAAQEVETLGDEAVNNVRAMLRQFKDVQRVAV